MIKSMKICLFIGLRCVVEEYAKENLPYFLLVCGEENLEVIFFVKPGNHLPRIVFSELIILYHLTWLKAGELGGFLLY